MQILIVSWDMLRLIWRRLDQFVGRNFHRLATGARIEPAALDNLGLVRQSIRAIYGATRVQSQAYAVISDRRDLVTRVTEFYNEADRKRTFSAIADSQWSVESLGWAACVYFEEHGGGLGDDGFRAAVTSGESGFSNNQIIAFNFIKPIMHYGIGMYSLRPPREGHVQLIIEQVRKWSDPDYRFLAYDGIGLLLAFARSGIRDLAKIYAALGIPNFRVPDNDYVAPFMNKLSDLLDQIDKMPDGKVKNDHHRAYHLLCRGYGRGLYFLSGSLNSALIAAHRVVERFGLSFQFVAEGVGFAFAMINSPDPKAAILGYETVPEEDRDAIIRGIADNLYFNDKSFPGFLDSLVAECGATETTRAAYQLKDVDRLIRERNLTPEEAASIVSKDLDSIEWLRDAMDTTTENAGKPKKDAAVEATLAAALESAPVAQRSELQGLKARMESERVTAGSSTKEAAVEVATELGETRRPAHRPRVTAMILLSAAVHAKSAPN